MSDHAIDSICATVFFVVFWVGLFLLMKDAR